MPPTPGSTKGFPVADTLYTFRMVGLAISPIIDIFMSFSAFVLSINCASNGKWCIRGAAYKTSPRHFRVKQLDVSAHIDKNIQKCRS